MALMAENGRHSIVALLCYLVKDTHGISRQFYRTCVRFVLTYCSKTRMVSSVEKGILRKAAKWIHRMMWNAQLGDVKITEKLMVRLGLNNTIVGVMKHGSLR